MSIYRKILLSVMFCASAPMCAVRGPSSIRSILPEASALDIALAELSQLERPTSVPMALWADVVLQLEDNQGMGLNLSLTGLTNTQLADILVTIPQIIRHTLVKLDISENNLTAFPEIMRDLPALQELIAHTNRLQTIVGIGNLRNLMTLNVRGNVLETLPQELANLTQLAHLIIDHNRLRGDMPVLGQLPALELLMVDYAVRIPVQHPE